LASILLLTPEIRLHALAPSFLHIPAPSPPPCEPCRVFLEESLSRGGTITDALEADAADLRLAAGLGPKEAASLDNEVKEKAYRKLLREEVASGRLDAAPSKAEVLGDLLERVRFDPDEARNLHRSLYRQKLSSLLEKKALSEDDASELARLQRLLCVPNEERAAMDKELIGAVFKDAVNLALSRGSEAFGFEDELAVKKAFENLRLDRAVAKEVLAEAGRKSLIAFVTASRNLRERSAAAKELRKMVVFSEVVLAPLVNALKTEEEKKKEADDAAAQRAMMEAMKKAREEQERKAKADAEAEIGELMTEAKAAAAAEDGEAATAATSTKAKASGGFFGDLVDESEAQEEPAAAAKEEIAPVKEEAPAAPAPPPKGQKDINLGRDLDLRDRQDIYRNFLIFCMTGDVVTGPMGVQMNTRECMIRRHMYSWCMHGFVFDIPLKLLQFLASL
jgi:hypothetical protein